MEAAEPKHEFPVAFVAGGVIVLLMIGGAFLLTDYERTHAPAERQLVVAEADKPYLPQIQIGGIEMSRASNMLGHELTYIAGTLTNAGNRTIKSIEVTVEFRDSLAQVVLRDKRRPFGHFMEPLPAGGSRDFVLTFESVPRDWNIQHPQFRVTGLELQ